MEKKRPGCLAGVLVLLLVAVAIMAITRISMYSTLKTLGGTVPATVEKVSGNILYPGADSAIISYEVNGKEYKAVVLAESGSVSPGDTLSVYYNQKFPQSVIGDEDYAIRMRTDRIYLIVAGSLLALVLILKAVFGKLASNASIGGPRDKQAYEENDADVMAFWDLFDQSQTYKFSAKLKSALKKREQGFERVKDRHDYSCMAYHNLLVLRCFHCCEGVQAYLDGVNSLKYKEEYRELSDRLRPNLRFSCYDESLVYTAMLAKNRNEAKELLGEVMERHAYKPAMKHAKEMLGMMDKFPRWVDYQKNYAANFYSRNNAKADRGDYSPACALLQLILFREGEKGYDLTEEEYVNLLDDYLMLSLKYFTLRSNVLIKNNGSPDNELLFIVQKPLKVLIDFLPDCEESRFRDIFRSVMKEYAAYDAPFSTYLPEYEQACKLLGVRYYK